MWGSKMKSEKFRAVRKGRASYTTAELIAVMAVAMFLMGLVTVAVRNVYRRAQVARAGAMVAQLEMALAMYESDWGLYPPSAEGDGGATGTPGTQHNGNSGTPMGFYDLENTETIPNLVQVLTRRTDRGGPYIGFRAKDLVYVHLDGNPGNAVVPVLIDPWKQAYVYVSRKYYDPNLASWQYVGDSDNDGDLGNETWEVMEGPFHPNYEPNVSPTPPDQRCDALEANPYNFYSLGPDGFTYRGAYYRDGSDPDSGQVYDPMGMTYKWDYSALFDSYQDGNNPDDSLIKFADDPPTEGQERDVKPCIDDVASWW